MDDQIDVLTLPLEEVLETEMRKGSVVYTGRVLVKSLVVPLNRYSLPIPGTDDEEHFGLFGDVTAQFVRRFQSARKELYLEMRVAGTQLSYYDYNEHSTHRVKIRMQGFPLQLLGERLKRGYWKVTETLPMLKDPALESPPLRELFGPLFPEIHDLTEKYLRC